MKKLIRDTQKSAETIEVIKQITEGIKSISSMMSLINNNMDKEIDINRTFEQEIQLIKDLASQNKETAKTIKNSFHEVHLSIAMINELSQENLTTTIDASKNAMKLKTITKNLNSIIDFFKV